MIAARGVCRPFTSDLVRASRPRQEAGAMTTIVPGRWWSGLALGALLGSSVAAAEPHVYVNSPRSPDGERHPAILWESEAAQVGCVETALARLQRYVQALQAGEHPPLTSDDLTASEPCAAGEVADLAQGTEVEPLATAECGALARVRVVGGRSAGKVGCVTADHLSADRVR
jgi:hypothetical protein